MTVRFAIALGVGLFASWQSASLGDEAIPVQIGMAEVREPVLYYETAGKGPAVVLIHGGNLDRRMWDDQFQTFARHFQVIRYDVRTYGLSDMPTKPYSDVQDLASLLQHLHIKKAHLVGLSLGGRIIIDFALEHPEMVASLVPIGPG
jgi:pimeloyl-ACP methyl ester carboxylesterase